MQCDEVTIIFNFKWKLSYKHHMAFEKKRPNQIFGAAKWLVNNSMLFKNEGIHIDDNWNNNYQQIGVKDTLSSIDGGKQENRAVDIGCNFENRPTKNFDILVHLADFREFNQILAFVLGKAKPRWDYFRTYFLKF